MRRAWLLTFVIGCAGGEAEAPDATVIDAAPPSADRATLPPALDAARTPEPDRGVAPDARPAPTPDAAAELDAALPDGPTPDGPAPDAAWVPIPDMAVPDGPAPDMPCPEEVCSGRDDDCDGQVDEGLVCADFVARSCRVFFGQGDEHRGPQGVSPIWESCPAADRDIAGEVRCVGTRGDERFAKIVLEGDVNGDDDLAVALLCHDARLPAVAAYVQSHCAVYLGWADRNRGPDGSPGWGDCPGALVSAQGDLRCTSSGFDGNFRAMDLDGDVDDNDDLGWAWICRDPVDPDRARAMQSAVELVVGWADRRGGPLDGAAAWGPCPAMASGTVNGQRCTSTRGDGRFHRLDLGGDVNDDDELGFMLRARP